MAEIVIDPAVPERARWELEQAPLSALVGFSDAPPEEAAEAADLAGHDTVPGVRGAIACMALVMALMLFVSLSSAGSFSSSLSELAGLVLSMCVVVGALNVIERGRRARAGLPPARARRGAAAAFRGRYVVPELDLHGDARSQWERASTAARGISGSASVRDGLITSVEVAAVLPYHLWDVAERLALLSRPERRQAAILRDLDASDPDVQAVLRPQRRVRELAQADIERRIGRLEEFAALAARADAARQRSSALAGLAGLNDDYTELLARLGEPDDSLGADGPSARELRAIAAAADDAVRQANVAGRALALPADDVPPT